MENDADVPAQVIEVERARVVTVDGSGPNAWEAPVSSNVVPSALRTRERWPSAPITKRARTGIVSAMAHSLWATA